MQNRRIEVFTVIKLYIFEAYFEQSRVFGYKREREREKGWSKSEISFHEFNRVREEANPAFYRAIEEQADAHRRRGEAMINGESKIRSQGAKPDCIFVVISVLTSSLGRSLSLPSLVKFAKLQ